MPSKINLFLGPILLWPYAILKDHCRPHSFSIILLVLLMLPVTSLAGLYNICSEKWPHTTHPPIKKSENAELKRENNESNVSNSESIEYPKQESMHID